MYIRRAAPILTAMLPAGPMVGIVAPPDWSLIGWTRWIRWKRR
jgi:hypothetical protein